VQLRAPGIRMESERDFRSFVFVIHFPWEVICDAEAPFERSA
jgi:hypothetical protein